MTEEQLREIGARCEEGVDSEEFFDHACEDIPALVAEVRRLREALEFYADEVVYKSFTSPPVVCDRGVTAKRALRRLW